MYVNRVEIDYIYTSYSISYIIQHQYSDHLRHEHTEVMPNYLTRYLMSSTLFYTDKNDISYIGLYKSISREMAKIVKVNPNIS